MPVLLPSASISLQACVNAAFLPFQTNFMPFCRYKRIKQLYPCLWQALTGSRIAGFFFSTYTVFAEFFTNSLIYAPKSVFKLNLRSGRSHLHYFFSGILLASASLRQSSNSGAMFKICPPACENLTFTLPCGNATSIKLLSLQWRATS